MQSDSQTQKVYSVSTLTIEIQKSLEARFDFIWVEGEISNFSAPASGHYYMVLKDSKAQIKAVMFRVQARLIRFRPENGMHVLVQGRLSVYAPRGEYQIILDYMEPMGVGALALAFEQLKKKLTAQGVFDQAKKRPLPFLPQKVAVITSPTGAAIRDFLKVVRRRFANIEIIIVPVRVQGDEACNDMVMALEVVNRELEADVIVLTRGGGSLEDLWAFNQEKLALAIRRSAIPVVSAVGHEIDWTISDLAADLRAPTPSAAAEILVKEKEVLIERLSELNARLISGMHLRMNTHFSDLEGMVSRLKDPKRRIADTWMAVDDIHLRLISIIQRIVRDGYVRADALRQTLIAYSPANVIAVMGQRLSFVQASLVRGISGRQQAMKSAVLALEKRLSDLSPFSILRRGYSITRRLPEMQVVRAVKDVEVGDQVQVLLAEGEIRCSVEEKYEHPDTEPDKPR
ncbi:Exodeoxyribonuclease 7 large subunit [uncultured Desulfobacterium sp.]|uniref:Exodeoxyribonuclease 7 large subunit n=1 Tax=uncultured Desulfobacterium sp. TaxID=201089 RepID=A0A445N268_9BACT|nr:Exodeoxyribonuclease 7 large subunit [uncultured Desulfobacterium sp.]